MKNIKPKYQKYPEYKDSGVEWLGEIPKHWEVKKVSHLFNEIGSGTTPTSGDLRYYDGPYNFLQTGDLIDGKIFKTKKSIKERALKDFSSLKLYPKGSLIIAMYGATIGKLGILEVEAATNQACCVLKKSNMIVTEYIFYVLLGFRSDIISLSYGGGQPNISQDLIKSLRLPIAPLPEQTAIANFLDDKTAKIDRAVAQKEKLIALLKERKQIIIQNAVTKGLNPNVKLKDSGVEWIGDIPEHWEVKRLKYVLKSITDKVFSKNTDLTYIGMENVESKTGKWLKQTTETEGLANTFQPGDILFGKLRPYLAKVYLAEFEGICSTEFVVYRCSNPKYFKFLLISYSFIDFINSSTYGAKMPRANSEWIGNQFIPIPTITEQKQIVAYIEEQSAKIDKAISLQQKQIEKLKEYKTVLIDNVVTGKIKVLNRIKELTRRTR